MLRVAAISIYLEIYSYTLRLSCYMQPELPHRPRPARSGTPKAGGRKPATPTPAFLDNNLMSPLKKIYRYWVVTNKQVEKGVNFDGWVQERPYTVSTVPVGNRTSRNRL